MAEGRDAGIGDRHHAADPQTPELPAGVLRGARQSRAACAGAEPSALVRARHRRTPLRMITRALFVRLEAKTGREEEVESFLRAALNTVDTEDGTPLWFALRFGPSSFAIFDAFPDDAARQAHLSGEVAGSLMEKAPQLLASDPTIERADVLAGKVDVAAL
jgi:quinol monooxygenase YgiN